MKKALAPALVLLLAGCSSTQSAPDLQFDSITLGDAESVATAQPTTSDTPDPEPSEQEEPSQSSEPDEAAETEYAKDRYAEIEIDDQVGDGTMVEIDEIRISAADSFLVIYNNQGLVLSSALVTPQSQPVTVKLQVPVTSSQELEAALYLDNGDGIFDLTSDLPILDEEGDLVHEDFEYRLISDG